MVALPLMGEDSPCPTDVFRELSLFPRAGNESPEPRSEVEWAGVALVIRSNGIPHYEFVRIAPNPLVESNREYRIPRHPKLAETPTPLLLLGGVDVAVNGIPFFGPNEVGFRNRGLAILSSTPSWMHARGIPPASTTTALW